VNECVDEYLRLSKEVFNIDRVLVGYIPVGDDRCRFDHNILEAAVKSIIKDRLGSEDCSMSAVSTAQDRICPTFVVAKTAVNVDGPPTVFRSYSGEGLRPSKCAIWQAARATSAAPSFFKEMYIDTPRPGVNYVDGGLGHNNPSQLALNEAGRIWPECKHFCIVSIGTGRQRAASIIDTSKPDDDIDTQQSLFQHVKSFVPYVVSFVPGGKTAKNFPPGVLAVIKMASALSRLVTNSEEVHQRLQRASRTTDVENQFPYFRFNVEREIGDIGLGDWNKVEEMAAHTMAYLEEQEAEERKTMCVASLINPRVLTRK
jgi:predicted acylesterase/phospholipase RssA